jgi:hypothetical protein
MLGVSITPGKAGVPRPANGTIEVPRDAGLSWRPGVYAATHNVYLGTDPNDVNDATMDDPRDVLVSPSQAGTTYQPADLLDWGVTYYWRIDEVNDAEPNSPWKSDLWSFEVLNVPIVIEDFEDYNDYPPNEVWMTWVDGYDNPMNGSSAGYPEPDFVLGDHYLEDEIVRNGDWSMPLFYDNLDIISEVTRTLTPPLSDMTREGVVMLTLFYYGDAINATEPMYVALEDAVVYNDNANAARVTEWTRWDIPLQAFADQGVNLSNVGSITIGFGNRENPGASAGGSGHVFFDDIRLYLP